MYKKGFGLLSVLILIVIFSFLSISIVQNHTFSSKIDKLKYLNLQSNIHIKNITTYIQNHNKEKNLSYQLDDDRFILQIQLEELNGTNKYHIYLKVKDDLPISNYTYIEK